MDRNKTLEQIHAYWEAANYLSAAQIYLRENILLREPLEAEHIKPRLLGHWGTCPGLNFVQAHLNRLIQQRRKPVLFVAGPGHGGPAALANTWLEGSYSERYPDTPQTLQGLEKLVRGFSWPGGLPSHVASNVPGSIHEGGELGYSLSHAFGAVLDDPDLTAVCVVGDGEAETGPLAAAWPLVHFLNPRTDGAVLPILHLNSYKISGPTVFGRMSDDRLLSLFSGLGYSPRIIRAQDPMQAHAVMADTLDEIFLELDQRGGKSASPSWPMLILRSPKGWTCPESVHGQPLEGSFRAHQVPLKKVRSNADERTLLEQWMHSYHPEHHFSEDGSPAAHIAEQVPEGGLRMGLLPQSNAGERWTPLKQPDPREHAVEVASPGTVSVEATKVLGTYLRDLFRLNEAERNFRIFCPDETRSNRLDAVFEAVGRTWQLPVEAGDEDLSPDGRVMEILSEHCCQGWLEGYLLTGRHGLFPCYEAFVTIVDSMVNQYAKWLKTCRELPWREPPASMNYLLTSHAWRQDHNGYSHQGPGFINMLLQKKKDVVRIYLPPDANALLQVADHCLRSRNYINLIISGKQSQPQWLTMDEAEAHCRRGASAWTWAGSGGPPDVVLACAGDVPTLETIAAARLLRDHVPSLAFQVVNVVDLMALPPAEDHPHGLPEDDFEALFTEDMPVVFAFHGYPRAVHELLHHRPDPERFHVHGYIEEGTTTTPFDMTVCNEMSRYHLALDVLRYAPDELDGAAEARDHFEQQLKKHRNHIIEYGEDLPEIRDWSWENAAEAMTV